MGEEEEEEKTALSEQRDLNKGVQPWNRPSLSSMQEKYGHFHGDRINNIWGSMVRLAVPGNPPGRDLSTGTLSLLYAD